MWEDACESLVWLSPILNNALEWNAQAKESTLYCEWISFAILCYKNYLKRAVFLRYEWNVVDSICKILYLYIYN